MRRPTPEEALRHLELAMRNLAIEVDTQTTRLQRTLAEGDIKTAMQRGQTLAPLTHEHNKMGSMREFLISRGEHR